MATTTRTYKTSDWKIWTYVPVAGKFRLDFSTLDGSDVLSSTIGSMGQITDPITSIEISDGGQLSNGSLLPATPSTAVISFELLNFTKNSVKEYYNGKRIIITQPSTQTNIDYGTNAVMFEGIITDCQVNLDTQSNIAIVTISCDSLWTALLNQQQAITKNTTDLKGTYWFVNVWAEGATGGQYSVLGGSGVTYTSHYGTTGNVTDTLGNFLDDFLTSDTLFAAPTLTTATNYFTSIFRFYRVSDLTTTGYITIPGTNIYGIGIANNPADIPSNYSLTSSAGASYNSNSPVYNILGAGNNYSIGVDVLNSNELQTIADRMSLITTGLSPVQVSVLVARNNQTISYDIVPTYLQDCGKAIKADLSAWGFSSTETMYVTGRTITVTPDDFTVSYTVTKGK